MIKTTTTTPQDNHLHIQTNVFPLVLVSLVVGLLEHFFNNAHCVHVFIHSTPSLYKCVTSHLLCGGGPCLWSQRSILHSHVHTKLTHTAAVIMCVFLCLFNLDGMFHLQAAITAGCLIVWVRLMGMCVSLCALLCVCSLLYVFSVCVSLLVCMHIYIPTSVCLYKIRHIL